LQEHLALTLHPRKVYLQHYSKGVIFLGQMIKPHRTYIRKRTLGYFYQKIQQLNNSLLFLQQQQTIKGERSDDYIQLKKHFLSVINSYLGFLIHCKSYTKRKKILEAHVHPLFREWFSLDESYTKVKYR
jgi:hypothetical protein